ncbi:pyridoxine 5'-phosphate oxidase C-terminal domain-containing protein [Streptomyces sp. NPDC048551]|uniref:pyridoxine 5'-phosphate oxidase C-terminal domain-containing protein n=1 Tax=Streptomyces sp. NPDC048551 TaxID=3155758 RepID=UPI00342BF272
MAARAGGVRRAAAALRSGAGRQFACHAFSPKGGQLARHPRAALTFCWAEHGRQVRIRGRVTPGSAEDGAADFPGRSVTARAESLPARQSRYLTEAAERDRDLAKARALIAKEPSPVHPAWTLHTLAPDAVEFWQAAESRVHIRLRHERADDGWDRFPLWSWRPAARAPDGTLTAGRRVPTDL